MGNKNTSCMNFWTLFILIFFILLLIYFYNTPSVIASPNVVGTTTAAGRPPCRLCDVSLNEQLVYGSLCCPVVQMTPAPANIALATNGVRPVTNGMSAAYIPPPTNTPPVVATDIPHPKLPVSVSASRTTTTTTTTNGIGRGGGGTTTVIDAAINTPPEILSAAAAAAQPIEEHTVDENNNVVHVVHHRAEDINAAGGAIPVIVRKTSTGESSTVKVVRVSSNNNNYHQRNIVDSTPCDPDMPCSKVETVEIAPSSPTARTRIPADFYRHKYAPDQVRCNDIQFANHCQYPGKFAFLRSPAQRYEDFSLDGVYGGKYCQAQCEPRYEVDGDKHCVCVCTVAPNPILITSAM